MFAHLAVAHNFFSSAEYIVLLVSNGRNYIRNGTKEYFRNPNIHISEGIQQALDYLGVPRSEISDRDQFREIIPVGMTYEWCTE